VSLAALDLNRDLRVDLDGSGVDLVIPGFRVFTEFTCSHFLPNVTFPCKWRRIHVLA